MIYYSDLWNGNRHSDLQIMETEAGKKLVDVLFSHSADIILAFQSQALQLTTLGGWDKERTEYLFQLADDIYDLIKEAESQVVKN